MPFLSLPSSSYYSQIPNPVAEIWTLNVPMSCDEGHLVPRLALLGDGGNVKRYGLLVGNWEHLLKGDSVLWPQRLPLTLFFFVVLLHHELPL